MSQINCDQLAAVAGQILEDAAFVFAEPDDMGEADPWEDEVVLVEIGFKGPEAGKLTLAASHVFSSELAANLLGVEPDDPDALEKGNGALSEMLNMICGAYVANTFGEAEVVELGIPSFEVIAPEEYDNRTNSAFCSIALITDDMSKIELKVFV